ncbi:MAG: glycosyltransferase family 4 protein, partial [Gammaproteobacteria bacterium]|nr:glycosyltransferase family 4 protein [Gammaproteobacteria bacterium]
MTNKRKVLVVTTTFPRHEGDDQPRFVLDLCKSLPGEFEQRVLAPSAPELPLDDRIEGIPVRRFRYFLRQGETLAYGSGVLANLREKTRRWLLVPFFLLGLVLAVRQELRHFRPDIVHAHWWFPAGLATRLAMATSSGKHKLLVTCHGTDYFTLGKRFPRLLRWVLKRADAVAMVSPAMRDDAISQGLPERKIRIAPMGVDLRKRFTPGDATRRQGVLFVGRLLAEKGVDDLLTGWAAASDAVRDQGLRIIGSGSQQHRLLALASSLGVSDSVSFLGAVAHDDLPMHYRQAALLVFPSPAEEGLGLVAIEAMGCNCAVLASDTRSLADVIVEGQSGFVYPMGDKAALARRLDELIRAPERCNEVATRGGDLVRSRFDWAVAGANYRS